MITEAQTRHLSLWSCCCRLSAWLGIGWWVVLAGSVHATETNGPPRNLAQHIDDYHDVVSRQLVRTVAGVDAFFADDRALEESDATRLRLTSTFRYVDGRDLTIQLGVSGRLDLPRLQQKLQLLVDADGREQDLRSGLEDTDAVTDDDRSLFTGLRWVPRETRRSRVNIDGGLRWRSGPVPFVRVRGRRTLTYTHWLVRLTQNFLWFEDRGLGQQTTVDFERWLDHTHLFRATPSLRWSEHIDGLDWRQGVSVFHLWDDERMIGMSLGVRGQTDPNIRVEHLEGVLRYRQRAFRDWLFVEVSPSLTFPRSNDFELTPVLTLKLEALFGEIRAPRRGY